MKLYTESQVKEAYDKGRTDWINDLENDNILSKLTPIELPSDEEAGVIALKIADTLKDKLTTEQEAYFIAGFQTYPKWLKEQILNQNK